MMRCRNCSGRFAEEIPSDETLQKYYAQYAYQGESSISKITRSRYEDILKKLEKFKNKGRLLEIGCGRGEFLEVAREKGWEVNGTEFSSRALEILSEKNIPAHAGDISQMDTAELFDVIVCIEVIEHVSDPLNNIRIMNQLLHKGGALYLSTPNVRSISAAFLKENWRVFAFPEHLIYYTVKSLKKLLRENGFKVLSHRTTGISIHEIRAGRKHKKNTASESNTNTSDEMRESIEKNPLKKSLKSSINFMLSILNKGDTHKLIAKKY
jgi:2-polyprenyl-3-methyl-5-hydroxy-6-metoxy-1,4-benzoquinol methylase